MHNWLLRHMGVTSALHSPLMAVTNAISSVIIVGALIAAGPEEINFPQLWVFCNSVSFYQHFWWVCCFT